METDRHGESQNRPAKGMPIVEEEEDEDEGHRVASVNSTTTKDPDSRVVSTERVKSKEDFKAPMLPPTRKTKPAVPKLNGHVTPNDLLAVEQLSIESELGNGRDYSELLDPFVNIGKHCYLCPHSRQYIASTYPLLPPRSTTAPRKKGSEPNGHPEEFIKEIILDDFSLLLFHSTQDYKLFKEKEDELREKEEAEGRRRLAEEKRRLYEENLLLGKVKKKGRKSKKDLEREQKEVRRQERLDRREQRRRATYRQRVQRRREKREQRNLEEGASLSPEERAARKLSRREAREERQRLRGQRKQEEKRLRRQAKLQLQQHQDPFHTKEQVAVSAESGDRCEAQTTTSMARGLGTCMPMPGSNSQPPSVGHSAARPQSGAGHPNGTSSALSTIAVGNQQQSSKREELKAGVKRSFSTIGIAQTKSSAVLDGGGSGGSGSSAVQHSPMASMNKARKLDSDPTAGLRETLIGIAAQQQAAKRPPLVDTNAYSHSNYAASQLAMRTPSDGVLTNSSIPANNSLVADPLLLLSQHMLAQQLMQSMGCPSRSTQSATAPTNTSTPSRLLPDTNSFLLSTSPAGIGASLFNSPQLLAQNPQLLFNYLSEQQQREIQQSHLPVAGNLIHPQTHHPTSSLPRTNPMDASSSSSLSAAKAPICDISFPAGAALASQLAGAAILGGKSLTSSSSTQGTGNNSQQRATTHSNATARKKVCWCNMHVRIAQFIARQQEMQRLGTACHSRKPEGSQPLTSHSGQQTSNFSNASVFQNVQQLQNFIAASGLIPTSVMGQPNYAQVPLPNTLHNQQQMALLASAGLLPSALAPQSQFANLPPQAVRQQQQPPSLLGAPLQCLPSSMAGLMTYPASKHPPPFPGAMAAQQHPQHPPQHHQQRVGKNVPMQSTATSALGFPVMPVNLGASGSLTSGTSNAAASAAAHLQQQQNSSAANLARLVAGASTLSSGIGGTGGVMEGGGGVGDVQAAILAQLLLSQLAGNSIVPSTTPMLPSTAGPCSSAVSSLDSQAIAAVVSLLGGSAASLQANLLPRAQNPPSSSSSYLPPPVPQMPTMTNPAPLANLMFPCSTSAATNAPNLKPPGRGVQMAGNTTTQGSNIQQLPLNLLSSQGIDRNAQMSMMSAANHLVLPSHHLQQQPQQLPQSQFKQQLPLHLAPPPQQSATNTNKTVAVKNEDSGPASGSQKATGQNTPLNSLLLSPPNSARLASLPPIEQELVMRRHLYTLFMNLGATPAADTATLPTIPAVPSVPTSTLPSSPARPVNVVHAPSTSAAIAASVIPPPPECKELRTASMGIGTTTTKASTRTTMSEEFVMTKKEEEDEEESGT